MKVLLGAAGATGAALGGLKVGGRRMRARANEFPGVPMAPWPPPGAKAFEVATRDGGTIYGMEQGPAGAPTVLLMHGITLTAEVWRNQFADLDPGLRVVAMDLRGFGKSVAGAAGYTIAALGNDTADVIEGLDLRDVVVAGHSMGGFALGEFLAAHPTVVKSRVRGAVLASSATRSPVSPAIEVMRYVTEPLSAWLEDHGGIVQRDADVSYLLVAKIAFGKHPEAPDVELTGRLTGEASLTVTHQFGTSIMGWDRREALESVSGVPTVILHGARDRIIPVGAAYTSVKHLRGARLEIVDGCGHMPMLERRERFASVVHELAGVTVR